MSFGITIIAIMSVLNVVLLGAVLYMFLHESKRQQKDMLDDQRDVLLSLNDLTAGLKRLLKGPAEPVTVQKPNTVSPNIEPKYASKREMVFAKLMEGATPEQIAKELGYSRSEIGIIMASAKATEQAKAAI